MATGFSSSGRSTIVGSDFIYDHICTRCHSIYGTYSQAAYYCPQCNVYYCKPCIQHACDHSILGKTEVNRWGQPSNTHGTTDCSVHPGNAILLYCREHQTVGCHVCMVTGHKTCTSLRCILTGRVQEEVTYTAEHLHQASAEKKSNETAKTRSLHAASNVRVTGHGVENGVFSDFVSKFQIETQGAGSGELKVDVRGPKGHFAVEMFRENRKFHCRYHPTSTGPYVIQVMWSGE